jgi:hypothetical protein
MIQLANKLYVLKPLTEKNYNILKELVKDDTHLQHKNLLYIMVFQRSEVFYRGLPIKVLNHKLLYRALGSYLVKPRYKAHQVAFHYNHFTKKHQVETEVFPYWNVWCSLATAVNELPLDVKYFGICKQLR